MEQPLSHLSQLGAAAPHPGPPSEGSPSWPGTSVLGQKIPAEVVDQIEVLKQQLRVYADDFATEREDRERNQAEKEKLKEELDAVKEQLQALEQQVLFKKNGIKHKLFKGLFSNWRSRSSCMAHVNVYPLFFLFFFISIEVAPNPQLVT